ncbi:3-isopropylmalate dehydratase small subunit [Bosea sp. 124]|uniref:3-isopropylmalate dehydratase small subunit n=1 Tax=Bosea sp. 124 TaxID=2135642 RepID=UPI000D33FE0B|nr:3-isopropylmalate dehydratase small subunit [Bosea sp. 124]PTM43432.1 3-isopropylmalate/(R)-2-methylmalate dehydratase small subunit [Bosea sp. 124]
MERFARLDAVALPIAQSNCDTDQIIPARYLQKPRSDNFGNYLFADNRLGKDGKPAPELPFNQPAYAPAKIVVAERNFGCGSSREHAVWALYDYGMRAAIAPSFGDIFKNNSLKNGLLPIALPEEVVTGLIADLLARPGAEITVDLPAQTVTLPDGTSHGFEIDPFAKQCLVNGIDELGYTLGLSEAIEAFENSYGAANT